MKFCTLYVKGAMEEMSLYANMCKECVENYRNSLFCLRNRTGT
uniref:Uncharacterized protein n=1 Tax=Anguilla anguilla TaxID=7936 RepID=A0A0E9W8L4_ANGAN